MKNRINEIRKQPLTSDASKKRDLTKILREQLEKQDSPKPGAIEGLKSPASPELTETSLNEKIDKIVAKFDENKRPFEEFRLEAVEIHKSIEKFKTDFSVEEQQEVTDLLGRGYEFLEKKKREFEEMELGFRGIKSKFEEIKQIDSEEIKTSFFENIKEKEQIKATKDNQQESKLMSPASPEFAKDAWNKIQATIKLFRDNPVPINEKDIDEQNRDFEVALKGLSIRTHREDMFDGKTYWVDEAISSNFERIMELQKSLKGVLNSSRQILEDSKKLLKDYSAFSQRYESAHREPFQPRPWTLEDYWS